MNMGTGGRLVQRSDPSGSLLPEKGIHLDPTTFRNPMILAQVHEAARQERIKCG